MKTDEKVRGIEVEASMTVEKAVVLSDMGLKVASNCAQSLLAMLLVAMGREKFLQALEEITTITLKDYERVRERLEEEDK